MGEEIAGYRYCHVDGWWLVCIDSDCGVLIARWFGRAWQRIIALLLQRVSISDRIFLILISTFRRSKHDLSILNLLRNIEWMLIFQNLESLDFKYRSKMDKFVRKIVLYKYPRVVNNKVGNYQGDWRFAEKKNFVLRCIEIFYRLLSKSIKLFISSGEATRQTRITITAPI